MTKSLFSRFRLALVLLACLGAGLPQAHAQDTQLARGDAIVTGFSGIQPLDVPVPAGASPLDYFFINLDGPSAEILLLSGLGNGPQGQLSAAPVKRQITAGEVGQVFAVTLDDGLGQGMPNIYLGATSVYGIQIVGPDTDGDGFPNRLKTGAPGAQFMAGQFGPAPDGAPGTIWRVDGGTGAVSVFANLPGNSGPGIGDIAFDRRDQQFFASDLDNGLIYRISADGQVLDSFDHGVNGRPADSLAPVGDDGRVMDITSPSFDGENPATWGYTQKARMVWGMAVNDGRLYYAVDGQVWSIGIADNGDFAGDPRWELDATALQGPGPITDMLFDHQDRMYLVQRGEPKGSYDYSVFAKAGESSVVRYSLESPDNPATPSVWVADADEYAIGMRPENRFADGGIALGYAHDPETGELVPGTCDSTLWTTGSRLRASENPDMVDDGVSPADVHGLQGNDAGLVRPQNVPPIQAYYIDYDGVFGDPDASGHVGDVAIWQPCDHEGFQVPGELPPGFFVPGGLPRHHHHRHHHRHHTNLELRKHALRCGPRRRGWACRFKITVKNIGSHTYFDAITIQDHLAIMPAGALVGFAAPPWGCAGGGGDYTCGRPPIFLAPGARTSVYMTVWVPNEALRPGRCELRNTAHITFAPGGSRENSDPADDTDSATAVIHAPQCEHGPPRRRRTNLRLQKRSYGCRLRGHEAVCGYTVAVTNTGPAFYNDIIRVVDDPVAGTTIVAAGGAGWTCLPLGSSSTTCTHSPISLPPSGSTLFNVTVAVPAAVVREHECRIINHAKIVFAPGGSLENAVASDDFGQATASVPAELCRRLPPPIVAPQCPSGYRFIDGRCRPIGRLRPRICPPGTIGHWPNCRRIEMHVCPKGTVGKWPNCRRIEMHVCPKGTVGKWPNCRRIEMHVCPKGTVGKWPNCRRVRIEKHVCPKGTIGKWPKCKRIGRVLQLQPQNPATRPITVPDRVR